MWRGIVGGVLADRILSRMGDPDHNGYCDGSAYRGRSKLEMMLGPTVWSEIKDKHVVDFGCGSGSQSIEMVQHEALRVTGIDILDPLLASARAAAQKAGVADRCRFVRDLDEPADLVVSLDGFEHFAEPAAVLRLMRRFLKPSGRVLMAFGPTWLHPLGGHLFSVFPWAHLVFTERALMRWRARFRPDGAVRFGDVEGGLNQMTIHRFKKLVRESPFSLEAFETVPIRRLRALANPLTRELLTSFVRCRLAPRITTT
jgi:SAM-dependent methyltransferase